MKEIQIHSEIEPSRQTWTDIFARENSVLCKRHLIETEEELPFGWKIQELHYSDNHFKVVRQHTYTFDRIVEEQVGLGDVTSSLARCLMKDSGWEWEKCEHVPYISAFGGTLNHNFTYDKLGRLDWFLSRFIERGDEDPEKLQYEKSEGRYFQNVEHWLSFTLRGIQKSIRGDIASINTIKKYGENHILFWRLGYHIIYPPAIGIAQQIVNAYNTGLYERDGRLKIAKAREILGRPFNRYMTGRMNFSDLKTE